MQSRVFGAFVMAIVVLGASASLAQTPNPQRLFEMGLDAMNGVGPDRNPQAALDYLHKSAGLGFPPAEVMLGTFYDTGNSVPKEPGQAATWYKKAALQDDPVGEWLLARLILSGAVAPRDLSEAGRWLQKSASHGDPFGEYLLGAVKLERQDYTQAANWFRKAAMQGMPQAQEQLALLLKQGQGVSLDKSEAYVWLLMSYDAGNQSANVASGLAQLQAQLTNEQINQAKARARDLEQTANRVVVSRGCTGWAGEFNAIPAPPPPDIQSFCR
jgi:TPR repeat protein